MVKVVKINTIEMRKRRRTGREEACTNEDAELCIIVAVSALSDSVYLIDDHFSYAVQIEIEKVHLARELPGRA